MKKIGMIVSVLIVCSSMITARKPSLTDLDAKMDSWHHAAAVGDYKNYFDFVTADFVFLGTAPEERWDKAAFQAFCKPYFDKKTGWDFKRKTRNWIISKNGKVAWFDEKLATWMEECRGSGVLVKQHGEWKLAYYNLTVVIENEKMSSFIALRKAPIPENK
jgi:ketosteroid isomerase-like protein